MESVHTYVRAYARFTPTQCMIIESASVSCTVYVLRCGKDICHENIVATQRPNPGYMLNAVTAPVLYKLIHYFMENPIRDDTVLMHPIEEVEVRGI